MKEKQPTSDTTAPEVEIAPEAQEAEQETAPEVEIAPDPTEEKIAALTAQAEDFKRKWYSVTAEYENFRRRTANDRTVRYREGRADVVAKLFPIADALDLALLSCKEEGTKQGIELVVKAFAKLLTEEHIEVIDPLGQPFDAEKCEAILATDAAEGEESGTVSKVFRKGYEQEGKVLRFAQVAVVK